MIKHSMKESTFALQLTSMVDMFTILIVFLLKSYSTSTVQIPPGESVQLPVSYTAQEPEEALLVVVSKDRISLGEHHVADLKDGKINQKNIDKNDPYFIKSLYEKLELEAKKNRDIATINKSIKFKGQIFMQSDSDIEYDLIQKIMYTSTMAGYGDFRIAAISGD